MQRTGVVTLTDCKAKFGTAVNDKKLGASQKIELHHNDVIAFGLGSTAVRSKFKSVIIYLYVHTCTSLSILICSICTVKFICVG